MKLKLLPTLLRGEDRMPIEGGLLFSGAVALFILAIFVLDGYAQYLCPACGYQPHKLPSITLEPSKLSKLQSSITLMTIFHEFRSVHELHSSSLFSS
jgi:hypothetical protein